MGALSLFILAMFTIAIVIVVLFILGLSTTHSNARWSEVCMRGLLRCYFAAVALLVSAITLFLIVTILELGAPT